MASRTPLRVNGLRKRFGETEALRDLDLGMEPATVLALLGPNGAGKTTAVEICEGFLRPDGGEVRVLGLNPATDGDRLRARIGVMPQHGGAYPGVRAAEMLRVIAACSANPLRVDWLMDVLGLTSCARTPFKRLSGGQQQRLALACAVIGRPELVFLDEPTSGLDPQGRQLVWEMVGALRRDGVSVLLTTHLMDEAEALADQVVIMNEGVVVAQGSPHALVADQGEQQLRFRARPGMDLTTLSAVLPPGYRGEEPIAGSYRIRGQANPKVLSTVASWCAEHGTLADEMQVAQGNLEDVFLELTGAEPRS